MDFFHTYAVPVMTAIALCVSLFCFWGAWRANGANHISEFGRVVCLVAGTAYGVFGLVGAWLTYSHFAV